MIRFLQTPGPIKKIVLSGILVIICISMAWYVLPNGGTSALGFGGPASGVVATVEGEDVTAVAVRNQAKRMIEQQYPNLGAQANMLMPLVAGQAAQSLISEKVLIAEARRMGLKATDEDLRQFLQHGQLGQMLFPGGKYIGQDAYQDFVSHNGYTVPQFEELVKEDILINKLRNLIGSSASVTDAEVHQQFDKQNTKIKFDYAVIKRDDVLKTIKPTDAELKAFYDRNKNTYLNSIPEKRQLKYVIIDRAKMLDQTQVTQQDLSSYYDKQREQYRVAEQVNARQILIKKPLAGSDGKIDQKAVDEARAKAEDASKKLKAGGNFAELAKKYSEDSATAKNGGALGWVKPDVFQIPAVVKVVSSLAKGSTSDVIDAGYAFVIFHIDDKQDAHVKSLDEVKPQIEPLIKQQKAGQAAQQEADQLVADARKDNSLEKAAAAKGLQVITTDFVTSKDVLPGIGSDPQFMTAAFAQSTNAQPETAQLHQGYAIYQVTAAKPPATPTFEEIRSRVEQEFKNERASQLLTQKTQELSDRAKADHDLKKAAKEAGAEYKSSDFVLPDGQVPDIGSMTGPASVAFTLKSGEISGPINAGTAGVVLAVTDRQPGTEQDFTAKRDQIRDSLLQRKQSEIFELYVSNLRETMEKSGKVKINQKEMAALTKQQTPESE